MAKFFKYFPKTIYNINDSNEYSLVTNLTSSFSFEEALKNDTQVYYDYVIEDGETPDIIAEKVYGSCEKHWIILKFNDIYDVYDQWPLENISLNNYIDNKYKSEEYANTNIDGEGLDFARQNIHSYYKFETVTYVNNPNESVVDKFQIDSVAYANVSTGTTELTVNNVNMTIDITKGFITYYEYEYEQNENKRTIKILNPSLVSTLEKEFERTIGL